MSPATTRLMSTSTTWLRISKKGGTFLLNCAWDVEELDKQPARQDEEVSSPRTISTSTPSTVSRSVRKSVWAAASTPFCRPRSLKSPTSFPMDDAVQYMKDAATKSYSKKGEKIVAMNHAAIERGVSDVHKVEVPASWKDACAMRREEAGYHRQKGSGRSMSTTC